MPTELPFDLTPELAPLSWLIGAWEGQGRLGSGDDGTEIVTHASAQIDTQIEYEDPKGGLRRLRGSGDYLFELTFVQ